MCRDDRVEAKGANVLLSAPNGDPLVTVNKLGRGRVIFVAVPDLLGEDERITPFAVHLLAHLAAEAAPVQVEGDVEYLINRSSRGWIVTLFNNNGVFKPQQGLAQVDRGAVALVKIALRGELISNARDWISEQSLSIANQNGQNVANIRLAAGGIAVVELATTR